MEATRTKINTGRVGVAMRGVSGTGVVCWPHMHALKQCGVCAQMKKGNR